MRATPGWCLLLLLLASTARAQDTAAAPPAAPSSSSTALDASKLPDCSADRQSLAAKHVRYAGDVSCVLADGRVVIADVLEVFAEGNDARIVGEGNTVFLAPDAHIAARRFEYHTATGTGTFEHANGFLSLGAEADIRAFGDQKPDVYFTGERLDRLGPRRFRLTKGGFTACVQPTPRWQFTSGSMLVELDDYVIATHTVLRVKGVPLFYWPYLYYPIQSDDRATGFLMPTYGASTFRGQAISNAFFWAIGRSHDATFFHDWFTTAGQGAGVEYRYVAKPDSSGDLRFYRFGQDDATFTENGVTTTLPATIGYELTGSAIHTLAPGVIARARFDYFSDVISQQLLHQNLYDTSRRSRLLEGGLTAARGPWSGSALYRRNEVINAVDDTLLTGSAPRVTAALAPQRLFRTPVYAAFNADAAYLPYKHMVDGIVTQDDSFGRFDAAPSVRVPLSNATFLSVNASAAYRTTYYTRQAGELTGQTVEGSFFRHYATVRTDVVGPVVSKIFELESPGPDRMKHVIEPAVTLDLTSAIPDYQRTPVQSDLSDFVVGGTWRVTYGVTNRFFFRQPAVNGVRGATREFLTIGLQQTSYSNPESSLYDPAYSSALGGATGQQLSPVALTARVSPSPLIDGNARAEYDMNDGLQALSTGATVNYRGGNVVLNYSRQRPDPSQPSSSFLTASTRTSLLQDRVSGSYSIGWDISRAYIVSHGIIGSYMAQCCGVQVEFQRYNYPAGLGLPFTSDKRLNFAFVLAGVGTFSNFFGAFGGS